MYSLLFQTSAACSGETAARSSQALLTGATQSTLARGLSRVGRLACFGVALSSAVGCGNDDGGTVPLADSGSLTALSDTNIGIPTTVAVADGVAWVTESQFDRFPAFNPTGAPPPAPFRIVGIPLDGGDALEIALPDSFYPEGITATKGGRLFIGSVQTGNIWTVEAGGDTAEPFVTSLKPSIIGMTVSRDGNTVWACNTDLSATPPAGTVVGVDITDGAVVALHSLPPSAAGSFCNDLIMSPNGALWVTESFGGRLFRIAPEDLLVDGDATVWLEDAQLTGPAAGTFGANGLALLGGQLFIANTDRRALLSIDPTLEAPTGQDLIPVRLTAAGAPYLLVRPDGITALPGSSTDLLVVENGLRTEGGKRLVRVSIDRL